MKYININGIEISTELLSFLRYSRNVSIPTIGYIFSSILLNVSNNDTNNCLKHFSKVKKIHSLDDGYLLINDNQEIKLGRFLSKIAKSYYRKNYDGKSTSQQIEQCIDIYKSWYKLTKLKFKFLKGSDILKGYDRENYTNSDYGMLHSSCMNNKFDYLKLYTENPDKVNLLVLVDEDDKIYGRALVWRLDNKKYHFMDRVYGANNYINNIFNEYATKHKMAYRSNEHSYVFKLYLPDSKSERSKDCDFKIKLKTSGINYYPYVDSLSHWDTWSDTFSINRKKFSKTYNLSSTDGKKSYEGVRIMGFKIF